MPTNLSQYIKRLGFDTEKLGLGKDQPSEGRDGAGTATPIPKERADFSHTASSYAKILLGTAGLVDEPYFSPEIIGGSCPRVVGEEEEIVWNAAAESCDTERVHVVWNSTENKIWFMAVRSSELASHPYSWCPFAAVLPGMKDAMPAPVCYTYFGDEIATMMTVTEDSLQVYRGTNLVVRAKAERTTRELGNVTLVELTPERIQALTPVPWHSVSLFEDRARRILAATSVAVSLCLAGFAFLVWLLASMTLIGTRHNLNDTLARTQDKTTQLMATVENLRASPMRDQLAKFADLNDGLLDINGFLDVYEIKAGKIRWRAVVPPNVTADRINMLGGKTIQTTPDGAVIGNQGEIEFEADGKK